MEEVSLNGLKIPVGRPSEDSIERQDLTGYMLSAKYRRKVMAFFKYWDDVVKAKAKGKSSYIHNMENFFGEILDKFEELPVEKQRESFVMDEPFRMLSKLTNLKLPEVFPSKKDNDEFLKIFLNHKFE